MSLFKNKYRVESARLDDWDYSTPAQYFVTICTKGMFRWFGDVKHGMVTRSGYGDVAHQQWSRLPEYFPHIILDEFIVMPNHVHGIIALDTYLDSRHNGGDVASNVSTKKNIKMSHLSPRAGSLSTILRSYKSGVTHRIRALGRREFEWQSRFYDHIIRSHKSLNSIREYIHNNPAQWEHDKNHPEGLFNWL